jgi:small subunit ribosomal protein S17
MSDEVMSDESTHLKQPSDAAQPLGEAARDVGAVAEGRAGEPVGRVAQTARYNGRKVREGIVTSNAMDRTAVVTVTERVRHRLYGKTVQRSTKLYVHDEGNECNVGDRVRVQETRPISKTKRWRLVEILERAR